MTPPFPIPIGFFTGSGATPPAPFDTKSIIFDGVSERLTRPNASVVGCEFDWNSAFTVNAWVRGTSTAGIYLASKQAVGSIQGWAVGFYLGQPLFFLCNSLGGNLYIQEAVSQTTLTGAWKMITWAYSGSGLASGCTTYINGTSTMPVPSGLTYRDSLGANSTLGAGELAVGRYPGGNYYAGHVADLSVWSAELTPAEVATLYNQGTGIAGKPLDISGFANLDGWWRMGDGPGDSTAPGGEIFDQGPNGNDLASINTIAADIVVQSPGEPFWNLLSLGTDGIDEWINLGSAADFSGANQPFSAAVWFKTTQATTADIFSKWGGAFPDWVIYLSGGLIYGYMQDGGGGLPFAASVGAHNDGLWHLAVMSWSVADGITIDIDGGADRVTNAAVATRLGPVGSEVHLAARDTGGPTAISFYNGRFDEPSFYSRALTAAECVEMYNAGCPVDLTSHSASANLLHWWRCGDATFDGIATGQPSVWDIAGAADGWQTNMDWADLAEDVPYCAPAAFSNRDAILFDGLDDRLEGAASPAGVDFDSTDPWSVSLWCATESSAYMFIVAKVAAGGTNAGWAVGLYNSAPIALLIHDLGAGWQLERGVADPFTTTGSMKNIVYTYDGSETVAGLKMYVAGSEAATYINFATSVQSPTTSSAPLIIGGALTAKGAVNFDGTLDEVAIFDRVLSSAEVASIYDRQASAMGKAGDLAGISGLVSWYRCGDRTGDSTAPGGTQHDVVGPNNLTAYNMVAGSTNFDNATDYAVRTSTALDGIDDYCDVNVPPAYDYNTPFTASAWFKSSTATYGILIGKGEGGTPFRGWNLFLHATGELRFEMTHTFGNYLDLYSLGTTYNTGTWYHVTVVYTAATPGDVSDVTVYVNGSPIAMTTLSNTLGSNTILTAEPMRIGARGAPSSLNYQGNICNVSLYDRALTSGEVTSLYNGGYPPNQSGLAATWGDVNAWWRMGDATSDTTGTPGTMAVAGPDLTRVLFCRNMSNGDIGTDIP